MTDTEVRQEFKFDVFISYRHAELDNAVAAYLQRALEHYHVPREIQKKCGKKSIRRVFRDEEELGVASDLFAEIEENLKQSEFLVVICSPRILESKWCQREIETFIKYRGRDNILPVLIEGEPETAFPPILLGEGEPLAADLRGRDTREVLRHAKERMPRLAAPLLYCSYDELYQRHRVYKMRRMLALAGVVTGVSLAFGAVTLMQSREIQKNYQAKLENQFRYLAQTASELQDSGDRDAALLVALEALPRSSEDTSRPYVAEARIALEQALYTYSLDYRYQLRPLKQLEHRETIGDIIDRSKEENVLLTTDTGYIYIWDGASCENLCCRSYSGELKGARLVGDHIVLVMTGTGAWGFDYQSDRVLWEWEYPACTDDYSEPSLLWAYDEQSGQLLCANRYLRLHRTADLSDVEVTPGHMLYLLDTATGESRSWAPGELFDLLEGDAYTTMYLDDDCFLLSPGGALAALLVQQSAFGQSAALAVFPTGKDGSIYAQTLTKGNMLRSFAEEAVFLDEQHLAMVRLPEEMTAATGKSTTWMLECRNVETGEVRLRYQDTCLCLNNRVSLKKLVPADGNEEEIILSVTYDNVAVNLSWATGERLARIEDRSAIALNHFFSTTSELIVTADGYLFATMPANDTVWDPMYTAYHYYIGLNRIRRSEWLDGKAYFFTSTGVYCYTPATDQTYTALASRPYQAFFSPDSNHLLIGGNDGKINYFDASDFSLLWEDDFYCYYDDQTAALLDEGWAVYLTGDGTTVRTRSLRDGRVEDVALSGFNAELAGNNYWFLRSAGSGKALVWNTYAVTLRDTMQEMLDDTVLWLVDLEQGEVAAQWNYRDVIDAFPGGFDLNWLTVRTDGAAASPDGRYVLLPCRLSGYLTDAGDREIRDAQRVLVWDLETGEAVQLPDEVQQGMARQVLFAESYFEQDGWVSPVEPTAVFYNEERKLLQVVDLAAGALLHQVEVDGIASLEVSFTPDGDHLIFQDPQKRLCVYNWREGKYTMYGASAETGYMCFAFHQAGQVLSATYRVSGMSTESTLIYRRTGAGIYKLETSVGPCRSCDGKTVIMDSDTDPRLYHTYTLDDLIAMAREILDGRELTDLERWEYLID